MPTLRKIRGHKRPIAGSEAPAKRQRLSSPEKPGHIRLTELADDCLGLIIDFLDTRNWLQFSYTCREINAFKYARCLMVRKMRTLIALPSGTEHAVDDILSWMHASSQTLFNVNFSMAAFCRATDGHRIDERFFAPLAGTIHTLDMAWCIHATDAAFAHLRGIHTLDMSYCSQTTITDTAFEYLKGIHTLIMNECSQKTITDKALAHVADIRVLAARGRTHFTDAAFQQLTDVRSLALGGRTNISNAAIAHMSSLRALCVPAHGCLTDDVFAGLPNLRSLVMPTCRQPGLTEALFRHLPLLQRLDVARCTDKLVTDGLFKHLPALHTLDISECHQLSDMAFVHLAGVRALFMRECSQEGITDNAFEHLCAVRDLDLAGCNQLTDASAKHLGGVRMVSVARNARLTIRFVKGLSAAEHIHAAHCPGIDRDLEHMPCPANLVRIWSVLGRGDLWSVPLE
jgi:hypothetical protein